MNFKEVKIMNKNYVIRDREAGNIIDFFEKIEDAIIQLYTYEEEDKKNDEYTEDFYEIYDLKNDTIIDNYDIRSANIIFSKNGKGNQTNKITLPVTWINSLNFNEFNKKCFIILNNDSIIIKRGN